jgi:hypothetical protein
MRVVTPRLFIGRFYRYIFGSHLTHARASVTAPERRRRLARALRAELPREFARGGAVERETMRAVAMVLGGGSGRWGRARGGGRGRGQRALAAGGGGGGHGC